MNQKRSKKVIIKSVAVFVISTLLFALAAYILAGTVIAKKNKEPFQFFGVSLHVVVTDSMTPEIQVNDYLIAKKTDISKVKVGDDVIFKTSDPGLNGMIIVHRVVRIETVDGILQLTTQGIKAGLPEDKYPVTEIVGVKLINSAILGKIYQMFTSPFGIITLIIVIVCIIIVVNQIKRIVKQVRSNKKDLEIEKKDKEKEENI